MKKLTLTALAFLLTAACSPKQESFKPKEVIWEYKAAKCITGLYGSVAETIKDCSEPETKEVVRIYNECGEYLFELDGKPASLPYQCKEYISWLPKLKAEVDEQNQNLQKEASKKALNESVNQCLRSVNGFPSSSFHKNAFGDYVSGPHPDCINVLNEAQRAYSAGKRFRCNSSMESYSNRLGSGDYYGANRALDSAVKDCN